MTLRNARCIDEDKKSKVTHIKTTTKTHQTSSIMRLTEVLNRQHITVHSIYIRFVVMDVIIIIIIIIIIITQQ